MSIETKFGNAEIFEPFFDINLFFPISNSLLPIFKNLGLTPNMITTLSLFCTINCYLKINKNKTEALISYFLGYLFDCMDGMMARKYNMGSSFGMTYDLVTDVISNIIIIQLILMKDNVPLNIKIFLFVFLICFSLINALNEAYCAHEKTGNDNFYKLKKEQLKNSNGFLNNIYLEIEKNNYIFYKKLIPIYNKEKVLSYVKYLRHFGPGNLCVIMIYLMNKYF